MPDPTRSTDCDVTIIGAGLAGKAACLHLARAGLRVICIEPPHPIRPPVGESLDWSAPDLLKVLGLPMQDLIDSKIATWKEHVILKMRDGSSEDYVPTPWLAGAPFHIELRTLHVDRMRLDQELARNVDTQKVTVLRDQVVNVESVGKQISAIHTAGGARIASPWFIDASGSATSLLARQFKLPALDFGPTKVAVWTYFPVSQAIQGTTLYMEPLPDKYLDWIWEIPINPQVVSVGFVTTGSATKADRGRRLSVEEIFWEQLRRFPRFAPLLQASALSSPSVTSFRCRVYRGVAGPNWLIAGEAASMVDPMTSNGVTAALRQAAEAAALIVRYRTRRTLPARARICYSSRVLQMAKFFNSGIEKIIYEPTVRNRIGLRTSGTVYTSPAWSMNVVYARLKPDGIFSTLVLNSLLGLFRASAWVFYQMCKQRGRMPA
jgi:flavin-dependent dehydrogenase